MVAVPMFSQTSISISKSTRRYNPENHHRTLSLPWETYILYAELNYWQTIQNTWSVKSEHKSDISQYWLLDYNNFFPLNQYALYSTHDYLTISLSTVNLEMLKVIQFVIKFPASYTAREFHYRVHEGSPKLPTLTQMNLDYNFETCSSYNFHNPPATFSLRCRYSPQHFVFQRPNLRSSINARLSLALIHQQWTYRPSNSYTVTWQ